MKQSPNELSDCTFEVTTANKFTCLAFNGESENPVNEPVQTSASDIIHSQYDNNIEICTSGPTNIGNEIEYSIYECTNSLSETYADQYTELAFISK